jgi:hypothetical protein
MTGSDPEPNDAARLRYRIAGEAARGVAAGSDTRRAVFRAARRVARDWVPEDQLPDDAQVRDEVHRRLDATGSLAHLVGDRFDALAACVAVLATVRSHPARPAEGDLLDHTLEVFDRVHRERPFDEELLTAALVHDVGMAIDRRAPVAATLEAIGDLVTPRTRWLVESLPAARAYADQTLGHRARKRLEAHPDFLDALLLAEADRGGGSSGDPPPSLEQAVAVLRALDRAAAEDGDGRHPPDPRDSP